MRESTKIKRRLKEHFDSEFWVRKTEYSAGTIFTVYTTSLMLRIGKIKGVLDDYTINVRYGSP